MASAKPSRPGSADDPRVKPAEEEPHVYGRDPFEPTQEMRRGRRAPADLDSGPQIGEGGEYLPAAYKRTRVEGRDEKGRPVRHEIIRQDF